MITIEHARKLRVMIEKASSSLPDEDAIYVVELFKNWTPGEHYLVGERVQYVARLYKVVQEHTAQSGWEPDVTPALFTEVAKPGEIPVWKQPTGAQDAYNKDDVVHYPDEDGPVYISTIDANVWAPDVYGWEEVE